MSDKQNKNRNPWFWVPSLYFAEGIPYIIVMFVASDMYKTLNVSNSALAFWTSMLYLPWVIKPLWSPLVDLYSTKRKWIVAMQIVLALAFGGVALALHTPVWFALTIAFLWLMALTSATHDVAADGFYMLALTEKQQAFFTGIRATFYRLATIAGLGILVMITGLILDNTGLETVKIPVKTVETSGKTAIYKDNDALAYFSSKRQSSPRPEILFYPEQVVLPLYNEDTGTDSTVIYFTLSSFPEGEDSIKMTFGQKSGSKDIYIKGKTVFVFNKDNWDKLQKAVLKVQHNFKEQTTAIYEAKAGDVALAWSISIGSLAVLFLILAMYHQNILPFPPSDKSVDSKSRDSYWQIILSFFKLENIGAAIAFLLLYRFSESQLTKMASPFLLDSRENGGLAMSLTEKGFAYGTVGVIALITGGILGGILASKHGLKKWIWWMALAINIPNAVYIYMSYAQPENPLLIDAMIALEQFGYGFGFTGYMLYMLYLTRNSKYKTTHFAIATGFMAAGMMFPGMISGYIQELLGYNHFFIYVMLCTIPSFIALYFVYRKLDPTFGMKE